MAGHVDLQVSTAPDAAETQYIGTIGGDNDDVFGALLGRVGGEGGSPVAEGYT